MRCYLCQENNIKLAYLINNRVIFRCLNDGLFFSFDKKVGQFRYDQEYYEISPYNQRQFFNNIYFQKKINLIMTICREKKPAILDVGCGWGVFLQVVKHNHLPYLGIDISQTAIKICQEKKLNCQKIDLLNLSKTTNQKYSLITFFQVIEHLKNPLDYLKAAKKLLKKNGVLLITTPNNNSPFRRLLGSNWPVYQTPGHYFFYSKKSLKRLFQVAGFDNYTVKTDQFRFFSLDYLLQRIFKRKIPIAKFFNLPIPTDPWGDLEAIVINQ